MNQDVQDSPDLLTLPVVDVRASQVDRIETLGNYALQIYWKDGHSFGIYTWEYMRQICPCDEHSGREHAHG